MIFLVLEKVSSFSYSRSNIAFNHHLNSVINSYFKDLDYLIQKNVYLKKYVFKHYFLINFPNLLSWLITILLHLFSF